jgi:methyltransferase
MDELGQWADAGSTPQRERGNTMDHSDLAQRMERVIRKYIQGCNDADAEAISACFCPDGVHYFHSHNKWLGAETIGINWEKSVQGHGTCWTVDQLLTDVNRCAAVAEGTLFNRKRDRLLRWVDWYVFDRNTVLIQEIRFYIATPLRADIARQELMDFDYAGRG